MRSHPRPELFGDPISPAEIYYYRRRPQPRLYAIKLSSRSMGRLLLALINWNGRYAAVVERLQEIDAAVEAQMSAEASAPAVPPR